MGAHPARNDRLDCIDHAPSAEELAPAGPWGQRPYTKNKKAGHWPAHLLQILEKWRG